MTANPNPGASGAIACPTCHSAIGEPCASQLQSNRPVPPMLHPHPARVAGYAPVARAAREAELAAYRASEEAALARKVSEHEREQAITAAALEWLDQAAAVTPPPDPEILDLIRGGLRHTQKTEDYLHRAWVERWERDQPRVPVPPATTPETAPLYEHMIDAHGYGRSRGLRHLRDRAGDIAKLRALHDSVLNGYPGERGRACEDWR